MTRRDSPVQKGTKVPACLESHLQPCVDIIPHAKPGSVLCSPDPIGPVLGSGPLGYAHGWPPPLPRGSRPGPLFPWSEPQAPGAF